MTLAAAQRVITHGAFFVWVGVLFVVGTSLSAAHFYTLPKPAPEDPGLRHSVNALRSAAEDRAWLAVHVLYAQCRCSRRILDHLGSSKRPSGIREKLLVVGQLDAIEPALRRIRGRGFEVVRTTATELRDQFHVASAPLLLVLSPDGRAVYSGGYTERKQGPTPRDGEIIARLMENQPTQELPLFGCAVSKELQSLLDPIGIRSFRN
jgi:hypothetical protein